jgi:hypothetical protein
MPDELLENKKDISRSNRVQQYRKSARGEVAVVLLDRLAIVLCAMAEIETTSVVDTVDDDPYSNESRSGVQNGRPTGISKFKSSSTVDDHET